MCLEPKIIIAMSCCVLSSKATSYVSALIMPAEPKLAGSVARDLLR
jgi:hypothetical protein